MLPTIQACKIGVFKFAFEGISGMGSKTFKK